MTMQSIITPIGLTSDYYRYGAEVYKFVNGVALRRFDREDSRPFMDAENYWWANFLGPCHAVMGDANYRVSLLGMDRLLYLVVEPDGIRWDFVQLEVIDGQSYLKELPNGKTVAMTARDGLIDITVNGKIDGQYVWEWRATIGEGFGAGFEGDKKNE